ncbi:MAG: ImmA/IrrE family metallo-endopeptidase [Blastocatellia bacterium]|nr:ImmA/IrrE family metallo-endopeptidase [Blastocatellia bacterium]
MWLDNASQEAIQLFWQQCGETEAFPRSLERSLALALPVTLIKLPRLKLRLIENWLAQRGVAFQFNCQSRAVRGCLVAFGGNGLIFIDGTDPLDEQRFSIAHELAHFLLDYWLPRERAMRKFRLEIAAVFDGLRLPTITERVHSLLISIPLGVYTCLLERDELQSNFNAGVWQIEDRADKVALALLAPPEIVLAQSDLSASQFTVRHESISALLIQAFGLPASLAAAYGYALLTASGRSPTWAEALRGRLTK